jgi:hypothetical protein
LTYTPRSPASNRRATTSTPLQPSDFSTSDDVRQLHSSQRRDEMYVSGYYWSHPTPVLEEHCVAWLDQNLDGPYAGKPDRIAKLSFKLVDDTLASFMQFYTALRAGLNACGFNPHLLPILPRIRHDADLVITPIVAASALVIGSGNDPSALRTPSVAHWQRAHDSLGMTLYALFQDSIRSSARHAYQALHNGLRLGETNGFAVLHELVRMHHPRVANSLAPSYASVYNNPPSMATPGREESYELSHATYSATFSDWETQLRYYPEFSHFRPTQLILRFMHGLLRELRPHILHLENHIIRHQATHRFKTVEPDLPAGFDSDELHEVLTAAVRSLDMTGSSRPKPNGSHVGAIVTDPPPTDQVCCLYG